MSEFRVPTIIQLATIVIINHNQHVAKIHTIASTMFSVLLFTTNHFLSYFSGSVDLMQAVDIEGKAVGVEFVDGFCYNRPRSLQDATEEADVAYQLTSDAHLSVVSNKVFPSNVLVWCE